MRSFCAAFVLGTIAHRGTAFTIKTHASSASATGSALSAATNTEGEAMDRRSLFGKVAAVAAVSTGVSVAAGFPLPAFAAGTPPTEAEIQRLKTGYEGIVYLLKNFEQETTKCRENGGECKRDADAVRKYLGLRSTTDPLFQIEKVFLKVKYMDIDPDNLDAFFEATEDYNTAMNMSNSMAFISQFGEYNPGGGKDEVLKYLNEAEIQVKLAEKALKTIINCIEPPAAAPSE
eukprot:CAMPEP_0181064762 /NCGR_PEP_ID=MMETSP1070-20121207/24369_1 /TAXON_ID=265543 /ORGANISM="Minutocellus polymorphus, Strain NH13" /LENGTH=231 /DNA_ID=CAMNT_0023145089 /DNA_START=19 /DNA_END=714 /DNA_ORIENTATION=+